MNKESELPYIKIHRGTNQIGGTVTEIRSKTTGILIDFGSQLDKTKEITNLKINWGTCENPNYHAVLLTHYHGDHIGEIHKIPDFVPVYFGSDAKKIALVISKKVENMKNFKFGINCDANEKEERKINLEIQKLKTSVLNRSIELYNKKSFVIGDIKITSFSADHSAYDSFIFLIEVDGKKIVHTGDYRFHGHQKDLMWDSFTEIASNNIDYLITEGTMMSRGSEAYQTEGDISVLAKEYLKKYKKVFILCSSTNIDYISSICSALPNDKPIIMDSTQKDVLDIVTINSKSEIYNFSNKKINIIGKKFKKYKHGIYKGYCMLVRASKHSAFLNTLEDEKDSKDSILIYGLWSGYIKEPYIDEEIKYIYDMYKDKCIFLHTSGHVYKEDLKKIIGILKPKNGIIPVHTENPKGFQEICGDYNVIYLEDMDKIIIN